MEKRHLRLPDYLPDQAIILLVLLFLQNKKLFASLHPLIYRTMHYPFVNTSILQQAEKSRHNADYVVNSESFKHLHRQHLIKDYTTIAVKIQVANWEKDHLLISERIINKLAVQTRPHLLFFECLARVYISMPKIIVDLYCKSILWTRTTT